MWLGTTYDLPGAYFNTCSGPCFIRPPLYYRDYLAYKTTWKYPKYQFFIIINLSDKTSCLIKPQ